VAKDRHVAEKVKGIGDARLTKTLDIRNVEDARS
jgi:hypothetical protein